MGSLLLSIALATTLQPTTGSVIFLHPDGTGLNSWFALRYLDRGPDGQTEWDQLTRLTLYRGHPTDSLIPSSNAGGTMHALGTRAPASAFGMADGKPIASAAGNQLTLMREAIKNGIQGAIVTSAGIADAGTGTFLAMAQSRREYTLIVEQMLAARPALLLGGGEQFFLPEGIQGRHGEGVRTDGKNLVEQARKAGYTVVFTREELLQLGTWPNRVLGLFAANDTFNDAPEEELIKEGKPLYEESAPTFDQMVQYSLGFLRAKGKPFFLVAEEEGTDNFAGDNNASGTFEALRRADRAIGVARRDVDLHKDILLIVTSDSMCGGMTVVDAESAVAPFPSRDEENGAPLDGQQGTGTAPFVSAPDRNGRTFPFYIGWGSSGDAAGNTVVRSHGWASDTVPMDAHATDLYAVMHRALFGSRLSTGTWRR